MACSLPGSSVLGISQARILKWVAISSSRGSSQPRYWNSSLLHWQVDCLPLYYLGNPERDLAHPGTTAYQVDNLEPIIWLLWTLPLLSMKWVEFYLFLISKMLCTLPDYAYTRYSKRILTTFNLFSVISSILLVRDYTRTWWISAL